MSSLKPDYTKLLLHLIVTVWKNETQNLLCVFLSYAINLPVNLFSVRNLQYILWRFLYINIFFSNFVSYISPYSFFNPVSQTEKPILAWHIKNNSTDVAPITACFLFLHKNRKWVFVDLRLIPVPSLPSSECIFLLIKPHCLASCHKDTKLLHSISLLYTFLTWPNLANGCSDFFFFSVIV